MKIQLFSAFFFLLASSGLSGCSTQHAPFHIYRSPLLGTQISRLERKRISIDEPLEEDFRIASIGVGAKKRNKGASRRVSAARRSGMGGVGEGNDGAKMVSEFLLSNGVKAGSKSISSLYAFCKKRKVLSFKHRGKAGDIVFFHNTYDKNGDRRDNDWYTQVAIVVNVDADQTETLSMYQDGKLRQMKINLKEAKIHERSGKELNSRLREPKAGDAPFTDYYSGQLFAGRCSMMEGKSEVKLFTSWSP